MLCVVCCVLCVVCCVLTRPSLTSPLSPFHRTTTPTDLFETIAYKATFGEHAQKLHISSIKGSTGHSLGAAGAFEAVACVKAIQTGMIPPTINYETPDPECDLNYTPNTPVKADVRVALSDNLGFGGHNGVVVFKKIE